MQKRIFTLLTCLMAIVSIGQAQLLFKVSGNGLKQPSYLFGTHHFAPLSIIDSIPSVAKVLDEVETVTGEIDMMSMSQMEMAMKIQPYMLAPADSTLSKIFSADEFAQAKQDFNQLTGMQLEMFEPMRPIVPQLVVVALTAKKSFEGGSDDEQLDLWIQKKAKEKGLQISGLETIDDQAHVLYNVTPITIQARNFLKMLAEPDSGEKAMEELTEAYMSRDLERLAKVSRDQEEDAEDKAFMESLLTERNANWMKIIPEAMKKGSTLFAVGALHLPGEVGLLNQLKAMGYEIEEIIE